MTRKIEVPVADTTLLQLLEMGARITFGSQRYLKGDLDGRYVAVGNGFGSLGLWDMDSRTGVDDAVGDLVRDAAEHGLDLHGGEIVREDESDDG